MSFLIVVQSECKVVSDLLCSGDDFKYEVKNYKNKVVSMDQLLKRLKLLYTLVSKINSLLHRKQNEEDLFECDEMRIKNLTHTIDKNQVTYVNSATRPVNMSRSIFARTTNIRSYSKKFPLAKLTQHLKAKKDELSFSVKLDELFNLSELKSDNCAQTLGNKNRIRETSILYNFSPNKRSSLRKAVLDRHCKLFSDNIKGNKTEHSVYSEKESLMDEVTSLQVTGEFMIRNSLPQQTSTYEMCLKTINKLIKFTSII